MYFSAYRYWRPTPLIIASMLLALISVLTIAIRPDLWLWVVLAVVVDNLVLTFAGLWPRCSWAGSNWTSLPASSAERGEIAITIDDGPDPEVTPAVLDVLQRYGAKATFFCIAEKARSHPDLCRKIIALGHSVENHSMYHRYNLPFKLLRGWFTEIDAAQKALTAVTGVAPRFFRAPAGLRNPMLDPVLSRMNLQLASWTRRGFDTVEKDPNRVLAKLLDGLKGGDILLMHDGNAARSMEGRPVILDVLPPLLEAIAAANLKTVTLAEAAARSR